MSSESLSEEASSSPSRRRFSRRSSVLVSRQRPSTSSHPPPCRYRAACPLLLLTVPLAALAGRRTAKQILLQKPLLAKRMVCINEGRDPDIQGCGWYPHTHTHTHTHTQTPTNGQTNSRKA